MAVMSEARVREHLANERTLLAWVRTSIALLGFGVVIARLRFEVVAGPGQVVATHVGARSTLLGLAFAGAGLLTLAFAVVHHEQTRRAIEAGSYQPAGRVLTAFVSLLFLLGLAAVGSLLVPH